MPKTMTAKAIAANCANAKKSTGPRPQTNARRGEGSCGPRTPEGKARSSRNAVTAPSLEPYEDPAASPATPRPYSACSPPRPARPAPPPRSTPSSSAPATKETTGDHPVHLVHPGPRLALARRKRAILPCPARPARAP